MIHVVLIGLGNVGYHLAKAFLQAPSVQLLQVYNRSKVSPTLQEELKTEIVNDLRQLKAADVYLIATKDDAVESIIHQLTLPKTRIAHTSGSLPLLETKHYDGVFYPLQTFSKSKPLTYDTIPFCIEAEDAETYAILASLAKAISSKVYPITTAQRQELHVSAVFVCNFVNHLYTIGEEICQQHAIPFEILHSLIEETASKIKTLSPLKAQTGPAIRKDLKTIERHIGQLSNESFKTIYQQMTHSIIKKHENEL